MRGVEGDLNVESSRACAGGADHRAGAPPRGQRRGLLEMHAGDRPSDDEALDFAGPLEDRVGIEVMCIVAGQSEHFWILAPRTVGPGRSGPT